MYVLFNKRRDGTRDWQDIGEGARDALSAEAE